MYFPQDLRCCCRAEELGVVGGADLRHSRTCEIASESVLTKSAERHAHEYVSMAPGGPTFGFAKHRAKKKPALGAGLVKSSGKTMLKLLTALYSPAHPCRRLPGIRATRAW